jgi:anti-sigma regulatory factor (Ser/Thr protein kinase)
LKGRANAHETSDLVLALGEACTNAVEHGSRGSEPWMEVSGRILLGDVVRFSVRDFGHWHEDAGRGDDRGRGLLLIRRLVDNVAIHRYPNGTEVILYHRLRDAHVARGPLGRAEGARYVGGAH